MSDLGFLCDCESTCWQYVGVDMSIFCCFFLVTKWIRNCQPLFSICLICIYAFFCVIFIITLMLLFWRLLVVWCSQYMITKCWYRSLVGVLWILFIEMNELWSRIACFVCLCYVGIWKIVAIVLLIIGRAIK